MSSENVLLTNTPNFLEMLCNFFYILICIIILIFFIYIILRKRKVFKKDGIENINPKIGLYALLISVIFTLYYIFIVGGYYFSHAIEGAEIFNFNGNIIILYILSVFPFLLYISYLFKNITKIKYLCTLTYPLIIINLYISIIIILSGKSFTGWIILLTFLIPLTFGLFSFIFGIIKDIIYLKNKYHKK